MTARRTDVASPSTIAFRVTPEERIVADQLRSAMNPSSYTEAFRWFLTSPAARELIAKKIRGEVE